MSSFKSQRICVIKTHSLIDHPDQKRGYLGTYGMQKDIFPAKEKFIPSDQITEPVYVLNLIALIIAVMFCFFLFRIIWSWTHLQGL